MSVSAYKARQPISPRHIKAIHAAIKKLGLDDVAYRARLKTYGASTCKDLTWQQAEELLDSLNGVKSKGKGNPTPQPPLSGGLLSPSSVKRGRGLQYADLDGRAGFASGAQCRLLAAMFAQVTRADATDAKEREKALDGFCHRIAGVAGLRMVLAADINKIVKALETMGAEHKSKGGKSCLKR